MSSHWPRARIARRRSAGRGARRGRRSAGSASWLAVARGLLHARADGARRSRAPPRRTPRPARAPRVDAAPRSSPRPSTGCRSRRSCAGRAARRRSGASGRPRAAGAGTRASSSSGARMSGPRPARRWSKRVRDVGHQLEHRPVELQRPRARRGAATSQALRGRGQRPPSRTRHEPVMRRCEWIDEVALEAQEQVLAVGVDGASPRGPASRSGQRSRPKRGCGVRELVRARGPPSTGRIRFAA